MLHLQGTAKWHHARAATKRAWKGKGHWPLKVNTRRMFLCYWLSWIWYRFADLLCLPTLKTLAGEPGYVGTQEDLGTSHSGGQWRLEVTSPLCCSVLSPSAAQGFWPLCTAGPHCCLVLSFLRQPSLTALQHQWPIWTRFQVLRVRRQRRWSRNQRDTSATRSSAYKANPTALLEHHGSTNGIVVPGV